jgi:hypothetical protein
MIARDCQLGAALAIRKCRNHSGPDKKGCAAEEGGVGML